jgi:uracil-DNA glycosylase
MNSWPIFSNPQAVSLCDSILEAVHQERLKQLVYPAHDNLFNAFKVCHYDDLKVVILGQDPYHTPGCAHGLSFSVPNGTPIPPSLRNIFKELYDDLGVVRLTSDLSDWARQGVLLLNTTLSVRAHQAHSHKDLGWEKWVELLIQSLNDYPRPILYVLWGNHAQRFKSLINTQHHEVLLSAHPSPLSSHRGFFNSKPFSRINAFCIAKQYPLIDWSDHQ